MKLYGQFENLESLKSSVARFFNTVILSSSSDARYEVLHELLLLNVIKKKADAIEDKSEFADPYYLTKKNALLKFEAFSKINNINLIQHPVIFADTVISLKDNKIIYKPKDCDDAFKMLDMLTKEKTHNVVTSMVFYYNINKDKQFKYVSSDKSIVTLKNNTESDIKNYLALSQWKGAAGAYRVQKDGDSLIESIRGDINNVAGLSLNSIKETINFLEQEFYSN